MSDQAEEARGILFARIFAHQLVRAGLDRQRLNDGADPHYLAELERIAARLEAEVAAAGKAVGLRSGIQDMIAAARERIANDGIGPIQ